MNSLLSFFSSIALCFVLSGQAVADTSPVGTVLNADLVARASGRTGTRVLAKSGQIYFLDKISTNASGLGEFQFSDGSKLAVGPNANVVIDQFVFKDKTRFQKLSLYATKGTFRWISGSSPSSAYKIRTPLGTMGIRGTAFDVTIRNGRVYVALISGNAKFCTGSTCRTLSKSCDYVEVTGRNISEPKRVSNGFAKREDAAKAFPYLSNSQHLSSRFHVGGGNCMRKEAFEKDNTKENRQQPARAQAAPAPSPPPSPPPPHDHGDDDDDNHHGHDHEGHSESPDETSD